MAKNTEDRIKIRTVNSRCQSLFTVAQSAQIETEHVLPAQNVCQKWAHLLGHAQQGNS